MSELNKLNQRTNIAKKRFDRYLEREEIDMNESKICTTRTDMIRSRLTKYMNANIRILYN
jgi:hypothetical protein